MLSKTTKNRFAYRLDKIFWFIIQMLPLLSWFIYCFSITRSSENSFWVFDRFLIEVFGIGNFDGNVIYQGLSKVFQYSVSIVPEVAFLSESLTALFSWFAMIEVLHLCFDMLLFIPRLAHKWLSKAVQDD